MASKKVEKEKNNTKAVKEIKEEKVDEDVVPEKKGILKFFAKMLIIFILIFFGVQVLLGYLPNIISYNKYGNDIIGEIFYAMIALVVMLLFKNYYVFTERQEKFRKSMLLAIPLLVFSVLNLISSIAKIDTFSFETLINIIIYCAFIGITEEFLCRGWIQNEFLERFGDTKKNIILSIFLSSLIYGLMHVTNFVTINQSIYETILQVINASACGFLLGTIYYKTKNIWAVIFLHAFYDFSLFLGEMNVIKECSYGSVTRGISFVNTLSILLLTLFWILSTLLVLNKCSFPNSRAPRRKRYIFSIYTLLALILLFNFLPINHFIEGYDEYYVCYEYRKTDLLQNYEIHLPHITSYEIVNHNNESVLVPDKYSDGVYDNVVISKDFNFEIYRNNDGKAIIKNNNTGYKLELNIPNVYKYGVQVIENDDRYIILIESDQGDRSVLFYSDFIEKESMSNTDEYMLSLKDSFKRYTLPLLQELGYITFKDDNVKYPFMTTKDFEYFMLRDGELFVVNK